MLNSLNAFEFGEFEQKRLLSLLIKINFGFDVSILFKNGAYCSIAENFMMYTTSHGESFYTNMFLFFCFLICLSGAHQLVRNMWLVLCACSGFIGYPAFEACFFWGGNTFIIV